jgi:hypothetical protein
MQPKKYTKRLVLIVWSITLLVFASSACGQAPGSSPAALPTPTTLPARVATLPIPRDNSQLQDASQTPPEVPVLYIPLEGPAALTQAEYSGMAWYQDELVLMPQYPQRMSDLPGGVLYAIPRQALLDFIQGNSSAPIRPREVPLISADLENAVSLFEGFEAIAFKDQRVYLSIEAREGLGMMGYLVSGQVLGNLEQVQLELDSLVKNPPQQDQSNRTDEAILIAGERVITFFESNGAQANPDAHATLFSLALEPKGEIELPPVEYRLTDTTEMDADGRFWMMNYFFPGDTDLLPSIDPIREHFGAGATHSQYSFVERLLEFQYTPQGINLTDTAPIQFQLSPQDEARNWEGVVRLEGLGFLVITDKFPRTILGFVAYP